MEITDSPDARMSAATDAYLARNGFFHPDTDPVKFLGPLKPATVDGHDYMLLDLQPAGGAPVEIWVDTTTHLIDRIVEMMPTDVVTTRFADYRTVDGLLLPFHQETQSGPDSDPMVVDISRYDVRVEPREADFALPSSKGGDTWIGTKGPGDFCLSPRMPG